MNSMVVYVYFTVFIMDQTKRFYLAYLQINFHSMSKILVFWSRYQTFYHLSITSPLDFLHDCPFAQRVAHWDIFLTNLDCWIKTKIFSPNFLYLPARVLRLGREDFRPDLSDLRSPGACTVPHHLVDADHDAGHLRQVNPPVAVHVIHAVDVTWQLNILIDARKVKAYDKLVSK